MKQDLLFRVLRFGDKHASTKKWANPEEHQCFKDCDMDEVHEHIKLCEEFGWMEIEDATGMGKPEYRIKRLTAQGHLDLARRRSKS